MAGELSHATRIGNAINWAQRLLDKEGIAGSRRDARILLADALNSEIQTVIGYPERPLSADERQCFVDYIERRCRREPVSRIVGRREFWSLDFAISPATLDPRPDSETLVEAILAALPDEKVPLRVLDLGTGSGCLLLALLSALPRAWGLGVDVCEAALTTARANAARLGLTSRTRFVCGDWSDAVTGHWQVIVSNPPYIKDSDIANLDPEVANFDPPRALAGGVDGLSAYRRLVPAAAQLLASDGVAAFEFGLGLADPLKTILASRGFTDIREIRDLAGLPRCFLCRIGDPLVENEKNGWNA